MHSMYKFEKNGNYSVPVQISACVYLDADSTQYC